MILDWQNGKCAHLKEQFCSMGPAGSWNDDFHTSLPILGSRLEHDPRLTPGVLVMDRSVGALWVGSYLYPGKVLSPSSIDVAYKSLPVLVHEDRSKSCSQNGLEKLIDEIEIVEVLGGLTIVGVLIEFTIDLAGGVPVYVMTDRRLICRTDDPLSASS